MARPILAGFDPRTTDRAPVRPGVLLAELTETELIVAAVQKDHGPNAIARSHRGQMLAARPPSGCWPAHRAWWRWRPPARSTMRRRGRSVSRTATPRTDAKRCARRSCSRRAHARLRAVTVMEDGWRAALDAEPTQLAGRRGTTVDDVIGEYELSAGKAARAALDEIDLHHNVESDVESWVGEPADVLIDLTRHLGMLVCGSRGYGPVRAVLVGAVSGRIVAEAHCPVIVVPRGHESRLELLVDEASSAGAPA